LFQFQFQFKKCCFFLGVGTSSLEEYQRKFYELLDENEKKDPSERDEELTIAEQVLEEMENDIDEHSEYYNFFFFTIIIFFKKNENVSIVILLIVKDRLYIISIVV